MIGPLSVLAVIVARGGSKGLPRKNVLDLGGKPVIAWSVAVAKATPAIDRVVLSSEDAEIIAAATAAGCEVPFVRPAELATDAASVHDVLVHAMDHLDRAYDVVVLLQATSPFRAPGDIDACLALIAGGAPAAISVVLAAKPPQWYYTLNADGCLRRAFESASQPDRRQDAPTYYYPNGAVYAARTAWYREHRNFSSPETMAHIMPPERSIDIDSGLDLALARTLLNDIDKGAAS